MDSRRAESFSDGVFAVAITILVFNLLPIADKTAGTGAAGTVPLTARNLAHYWPAYLAYVVSFLTIGIMWINHHTMLSQVSKVNRAVLVLNLFLLMGIVAIPFPTALVADHLTGSDGGQGQATVAAVIYGLVMIVISVGYGATWIYLAAHQEELGARRRVHRPRLSTVPVHHRERRLCHRHAGRLHLAGDGADHFRAAGRLLHVRAPAVGPARR